MMRYLFMLFYQIFFALIYLPLLFLFLLRKRLSPKYLKKRFSFDVPQTDILFHIASIGEFNGIRNFIFSLKTKKPHLHITVSCITDSAYNIIRKTDFIDSALLLPVDFYLLYAALFKKLMPKIVVLTETEYWPAFLFFLAQKKIPFFYLNARITSKNQKFYRLFKKIIQRNLNYVSVIYTAGSREYEKINKLFSLRNIKTGFSLKYLDLSLRRASIHRSDFNIDDSEKVITFGSIHSDEFAVLKDDFTRLLSAGYRLIVAPRHIGKASEFLEKFRTYSAVGLKNPNKKKDWNVLVLDKYGVLNDFYGISDFSVVCGTFDNIGGHNIVEPIVYNVPVFFGKSFVNFEEEGEIILRYYNALLTPGKILQRFNDVDIPLIRKSIPTIIKHLRPSPDFIKEIEEKLCVL